MKKHTIVLLLCAALLSAQSVAAKTPKQMADNVLSLTEAAAILNVCFESKAYKKLPVEEALELHGLEIRVTDLVQKITDHYNDEALYMTYEKMRLKISSDPAMKEYGRKEYQYCSNHLLSEMDAYLAENEQLINGFFAKERGGGDKTAWPNVAKHSYIDRCTSSMKSQGLATSYARPYCSCITDGMEKEFGMNEYDQMMNAQPKSTGSPYDQRLYKVFSFCSYILPQ